MVNERRTIFWYEVHQEGKLTEDRTVASWLNAKNAAYSFLPGVEAILTSISWKNDDNHHRGSGEIVIRTKGNSTTAIYLPSRPHVTTSKKEQMSSEKISLWKEPILCESQSRLNISFCSVKTCREAKCCLFAYICCSFQTQINSFQLCRDLQGL